MNVTQIKSSAGLQVLKPYSAFKVSSISIVNAAYGFTAVGRKSNDRCSAAAVMLPADGINVVGLNNTKSCKTWINRADPACLTMLSSFLAGRY